MLNWFIANAKGVRWRFPRTLDRSRHRADDCGVYRAEASVVCPGQRFTVARGDMTRISAGAASQLPRGALVEILRQSSRVEGGVPGQERKPLLGYGSAAAEG